MLRTVAYGDPDPANHAAMTFGRAEVSKKFRMPLTKNATAPSTQLVMPCATLFHAQPIGLATMPVMTLTGFGISIATGSIITATPMA